MANGKKKNGNRETRIYHARLRVAQMMLMELGKKYLAEHNEKLDTREFNRRVKEMLARGPRKRGSMIDELVAA